MSIFLEWLTLVLFFSSGVLYLYWNPAKSEFVLESLTLKVKHSLTKTTSLETLVFFFFPHVVRYSYWSPT